MEALKNVVFNTPDDEEFKAFISENITENLNHARHVETEIHNFFDIAFWRSGLIRSYFLSFETLSLDMALESSI